MDENKQRRIYARQPELEEGEELEDGEELEEGEVGEDELQDSLGFSKSDGGGSRRL